MSTETESESVETLRRAGELLGIVLHEGVVEETPVGLAVCDILADMGLVVATVPAEIDGAAYRRMSFSFAGRIARREHDVAGADEEIVTLAHKVDELQRELNFDDTKPATWWSRSDVISLVAARQRLRPLPRSGEDEPRLQLLLSSDENEPVIEQLTDVITTELEDLLPDREATVAALRDRCTPNTETGRKLAMALQEAGFAIWLSHPANAETVPLQLTSIGRVLLVAVGKMGRAPW
jgi:hypothetical protein